MKGLLIILLSLGLWCCEGAVEVVHTETEKTIETDSSADLRKEVVQAFLNNKLGEKILETSKDGAHLILEDSSWTSVSDNGQVSVALNGPFVTISFVRDLTKGKHFFDEMVEHVIYTNDTAQQNRLKRAMDELPEYIDSVIFIENSWYRVLFDFKNSERKKYI